MSEFERARRLTDVAAAVDLRPLPSGDPRYEDISGGRGTDQLKRLRLCLSDHNAQKDLFAKIAFTGHRGCGKSTELLRLEHDVRDRFTTLHVYAEEALLGDYDYTDLFLWLVDELVRKFEEDGTPLNPQLAEDVAQWFAEVTLGDVETVKKEIALEAGAEAEGKVGLFWFSSKLLARLKSIMVGSNERRKEIRRKLQSYSTELIRRVNLLLDNAHTVLGDHGRPADLLIIVDNLDRLTPEVSEALFFREGDLLKSPRAHLIYTVPIATVLAPRSIGTVFEKTFTLPMVKVRSPKGKAAREGLDALTRLVERRIDLDSVFKPRQVVRKLAEMSGGNVRDLMRLIYGAQLSARADDKGMIDNAAAKRAILDMQLDYERLLVPARTYFPLLAQIHLTKGDGSAAMLDADPERVEKYRAFFSQFLFNGSVLEYNGDAMWYDVHPIIQGIETFQETLADVEGQAPPAAEG